MGNLTNKEKEMLEFIKAYMKEYGTTPSFRDIGNALNMYSLNTVYTHFKKLIMKGYISKLSGKRYQVKGMHYVERDDV